MARIFAREGFDTPSLPPSPFAPFPFPFFHFLPPPPTSQTYFDALTKQPTHLVATSFGRFEFWSLEFVVAWIPKLPPTFRRGFELVNRTLFTAGIWHFKFECQIPNLNTKCLSFNVKSQATNFWLLSAHFSLSQLYRTATSSSMFRLSNCDEQRFTKSRYRNL